MSLVTQIAALATRVAAEIKLLRTEIPPDLPAYSGTSAEVLVQGPGGTSWSASPSLTGLSTSQDISIAGMTVGLGGGAGETNMAMGVGSLSMNDSGFGNCAAGANALSENVSGNYNCAVGFSALAALATGSDNTALGTLAGSQLETGGSNTFVGRSAGSAVKTGSSNTIIGRYTGTAGLTGTIVLAAGITVRAWCDSTGQWGLGTGSTALTASLDVAGDSLRLRTAATPASASAPGAVGTVHWDTSYLYVCVAADTWKCLPLAAFGATAGGGGGGGLGVPVYVQQTQPDAPAIWYQTDADGVVIDILRVT